MDLEWPCFTYVVGDGEDMRPAVASQTQLPDSDTVIEPLSDSETQLPHTETESDSENNIEQGATQYQHEHQIQIQILEDVEQIPDAETDIQHRATEYQHQLQLLEDVSKDQWKYLKYIWVIFNVTMAYFGINYKAHGWLNVIEVEVCFITVSPILGVLFHVLYQKIMEERHIRGVINGAGGDGAARSQYQLFLFIASICLISVIYVFTWLNAVLYRTEVTS